MEVTCNQNMNLGGNCAIHRIDEVPVVKAVWPWMDEYSSMIPCSVTGRSAGLMELMMSKCAEIYRG